MNGTYQAHLYEDGKISKPGNITTVQPNTYVLDIEVPLYLVTAGEKSPEVKMSMGNVRKPDRDKN